MAAQALLVDALPLDDVARPASVRSARPTLRLVGPDEVAFEPTLRLTRRGRLVRTLLGFGALCLLVLVLWARYTATALPATHSVTVRPGQTLSEIAAAELPMVPTESAVVRIRLANGLNTTAVLAGQSIVIPGED